MQFGVWSEMAFRWRISATLGRIKFRMWAFSRAQGLNNRSSAAIAVKTVRALVENKRNAIAQPLCCPTLERFRMHLRNLSMLTSVPQILNSHVSLPNIVVSSLSKIELGFCEYFRGKFELATLWVTCLSCLIFCVACWNRRLLKSSPTMKAFIIAKNTVSSGASKTSHNPMFELKYSIKILNSRA